MRPARSMHEPFATDMIVSAVTVGLQDACKVAQELFGTFSLPTHSQVEDHRSARPAVLPEVSLMIFSPTIVHLHSNGRFIGLNVGAAQQLLAHRGADRP